VVGFDDDFPQTVATVRIRARVAGAGPVEIGVLGAGSWRLEVDGAASAHELTTSGTASARRSWPRPPRCPVRDAREVEATATLRIAAGSPMAGAGLFGLVARPSRREPETVIAEAVAAAQGADVAVVVVGLTAEQETEAVDKTTLALPGGQDALVSASPRPPPATVVVVNAATPVLMPWLAEVDAVLWAGLPGQEAGHAVAAAVLGDIEPAGRLVSTFPAADGAAPAWSVTPVDGALPYREGTFIGHRGHYAGRAPTPAFWFGHGLATRAGRTGRRRWTDRR
jgi:beta-glucosidase